MDDIATRLAEVRSRIDAVRASGQEVTIVAVTKTFPVDLVERAVRAGLGDIGENYAQDLAAKADELAGRDSQLAAGVTWHFIGGLQRNKIKMLGSTVVDLWQTIDRSSLVKELAKRCPGASMMVQVNTTGEPQKSGCEPDELAELVTSAVDSGLDVVGLMTIGPTDGSDPRPAFDRLRSLGHELGLAHLSMGMSGDFETAVECGSTMVRIGSALFGPRSR